MQIINTIKYIFFPYKFYKFIRRDSIFTFMQTEKTFNTETSYLRISNNSIIELITEHRNELITKLLTDSSLKFYLSERYQIKALSPVKLEFIKRGLIELSTTTVDQVHYASLILEIRKTDESVISGSKEEPFHTDIKRSIINYL